MEVGGWVQVSLGIFIFFGKSSQTLQKVDGYYDLSDGFPKKSLYVRWVGGVSSIQFFLDFWNFFTLQSPLN